MMTTKLPSRRDSRSTKTQTKPLIDYYEKQAKLRRIDGVGSMDDILGRITGVLGIEGHGS